MLYHDIHPTISPWYQTWRDMISHDYAPPIMCFGW
jgi:hypothetical protein